MSCVLCLVQCNTESLEIALYLSVTWAPLTTRTVDFSLKLSIVLRDAQ